MSHSACGSAGNETYSAKRTFFVKGPHSGVDDKRAQMKSTLIAYEKDGGIVPE